MKNWQRPLLLFSLALNIGFVSLAAVHHLRTPLPPMLHGGDSPRAMALMQRWQQHRHEEMARALDLDPAQRDHFGGNFQAMRPALRAARHAVMAERRAYGDALARGDAAGARALQRSLSQAQARVDSLCAELMLQESAVLRPEQRVHYVQWMFRPGEGPGAGFGPGPGMGRMHDHDLPRGTAAEPPGGPVPPPDAPPPGGPHE